MRHLGSWTALISLLNNWGLTLQGIGSHWNIKQEGWHHHFSRNPAQSCCDSFSFPLCSKYSLFWWHGKVPGRSLGLSSGSTRTGSIPGYVTWKVFLWASRSCSVKWGGGVWHNTHYTGCLFLLPLLSLSRSSLESLLSDWSADLCCSELRRANGFHFVSQLCSSAVCWQHCIEKDGEASWESVGKSALIDQQCLPQAQTGREESMC